MITLNMSTSRAAAGAAGLLSVAVLAAGCASASVGPQAGSSASHAPAASTSATSPAATSPAATGATGSGSGTASAPGVSGSAPAASATATPVPTVSGGPVPVGTVACTGWPSSAQTGTVPASFAPVTAERCVDSAQEIAGKGLWSTATLERADGDLAALVTALRQPSAGRKPGTMCPALAEIPPAIMLISASGQELIPKIPVSGCGLTQSAVNIALGQLHWKTVSVRLVSQIPGVTVSGSPRALQSGAVSS